MAPRKTSLVLSQTKPATEAERLSSSIIWDLGRAYFAYVGLLERVLVEQKLDHILRPGMGVVLFALYEKDRVTIKDLAERSQLACSTLTGVLQRMEDAGVITRTRDADDGRLVRVALTSLGRKLKSKCHEVAGRMTDISEQGVGHENASQCSKFLQGLTSAYRHEEQRISTALASKTPPKP